MTAERFVVAGWVVLGKIICQVLASGLPVVLILPMGLAALYTIESHVHGLKCIGENYVGE